MSILIEDYVSDPVEPVLDSPVPLDPGGDGLGLGVDHGQRADQVDRLNTRLPSGCLSAAVLAHVFAVPGGSGESNLDHLGDYGEVSPLGASTALTVRPTRRPS